MLESMIMNPRPTRAECADVANAVIDGSDAVMLSGETANGDYSNEAVRMMSNICLEAEGTINFDAQFTSIRQSVLHKYETISASESVASSAVKTAWDVHAKIIVVLTESGNTSRLISKYRPALPIVAMTSDKHIANQMQGYHKNTWSIVIDQDSNYEDNLNAAIEFAKKQNWVVTGDKVVFVHGSQKNVKGSTNLLRIVIA